VPEAGDYVAEIDPDTLPEGVALTDADRVRLENVNVRSGQQKNVLFPLGERSGRGTSAFEQIVDRAAQGIRTGSIIALAAIGLSLIFGVTGLVNFAHGELVTFGALVAWFFNASTGGPQWPLVVAAVAGVVAGAAGGFGLERGRWRPRRDRRLGNIALMVVSIGLSILLRHVFLLVYGGAPRRYTDFTIQDQLDIGPVSMLPKDVVITLLSLVVLVLVGLALKGTRLGTAMRAVADSPDLASSSGIDAKYIVLVTWVAGAALAALGGILFGTSQTVAYDSGFILLLLMFSAVVLGGLGSAYGAMVGGLVIGVIAEVSTYWLDTEFRVVSALAVLVVVLLFRPQGILGIRERVG
jgi:branched-chain amino acid transport system permease protein